MNKVFAGLLVLFSSVACSQTNNWKIVDVTAPDKTVVGHIYHTYAVGTETSANHPPVKVVSGLRLACASKNYVVQGGSDPIIAVFWHQLPQIKPVSIDTWIDGKKQDSLQWTHDGNLVFRRWTDSRVLIDAMKTGKSINLAWEENSIKRTVIFDLKAFSQNLADFVRLCNMV